MHAAEQTADNPYALFGDSVAQSTPDVRVAFVRKTYLHLAAAIYAFVALEWFYFSSGIADTFIQWVGNMPYGMLIVFGAFILVSFVADRWAQSSTSPTTQYAGLFAYVLAQSIFFIPMLWFAQSMTVNVTGMADGATPWEVGVIPAAGITTLLVFGGLSAIPWMTGKDFSFLGAGLGIAGMGIFALIVASFFLPQVNLGVWFSVAMIVFASLYILYDTSMVMKHYHPTQHVAASLALFASVALLFWYVLRLFMAFASDD